MKLYLSSYKFGNNTAELKKWIEKNENNKVLFIANARDVYEDSEIKTEKINNDKKMLEEIGFEVTQISLKDYFNNYAKLKEDIKDYNIFCVIGGNAFALRKAMQLSGFDTYLKEISNKKDYLYIGYSAGICVLGKSMNGLELVDKPLNPYNNDEVLYEGIGLLDYLPVPHYDSPNHPESKFITNVVKYLDENRSPYKTLKDGDVIIEEI